MLKATTEGEETIRPDNQKMSHGRQSHPVNIVAIERILGFCRIRSEDVQQFSIGFANDPTLGPMFADLAKVADYILQYAKWVSKDLQGLRSRISMIS